MRRLLTMKHWQIFVALIGGIFLLEFIALSSVFSSVSANDKPEPSDFNVFFVVMPIMMIYSLYFTYGWQWAIISLLKDKMPSDIQFKHKRIKAFFIIPMVYVIGLFLLMGLFMFNIVNSPDPEHYFEGKELGPIIALLFLLMVPLHLFSIFCMFHTMYFAAKTLKTVELQREVTFNDFAAEFFLIWFNVIGLWILQPRLNKIIQGEIEPANSSDIIEDLDSSEEEVL